MPSDDTVLAVLGGRGYGSVRAAARALRRRLALRLVPACADAFGACIGILLILILIF